jgi:hypothetical protein
VRLDVAAARRPLVARVVEAQPLARPDRRRDRGEHVRVDGRAGAGHCDRRGLQRPHPVPQPRRQHLLQFGQRAHRRLADAGDARRGPQPDRDGHRFVVVQQQRRELSTRAEAVTALDAGGGLDRVAEFAQLADVGADGARGDAEPAGQVGAGPVAPRFSDSSRRRRAEVCNIRRGSHESRKGVFRNGS